MNDVDLLIHGRDLRRAIQVLTESGWVFAQGRAGEAMRFARLFHAVLFRHPSGIELDLHRHILEESNWKGADAAVWDRSREIELSGRRIVTLDPTDHLLQGVVHGTRWDPVPPIRWIPDAVTLIRKQALDWGLLGDEAERRGVSLAVGAALRFLVEEFDAPVPAEAIVQMDQVRTSLIERLDFKFEQSGPGAIPHVLRYVTRYLRLTSRRGFVKRASMFPLYLRAMWGLESARQIPGDAVRRTWIRARGGDPGRPGVRH